MRMISAINLKRYQSSSPHTKIMMSHLLPFLSQLKLAVIQFIQLIQISKYRLGCVVQQNRAGEFLFCEAVKVDVSLSDADLRKNARNTISLLKVLFEDLSEAQNWYDDVSENLSDSEQRIANMSSLFNSTNESGDLDGSLVG